MPKTFTRPPRLWKRMAPGAALLLILAAGVVAFLGFTEIGKLGEALQPLPVPTDPAGPGEPQTILLVGSDRRAKGSADARNGTAVGARSDTMLLLRLDPGKPATKLLSLPRDLRVRIPGHGSDKLNAAFAIGGPQLLLRTIRNATGLKINHLINVDFGGFRAAVNQIGCVYVDIDRRYFNDNSGPGPHYAAIDVKPGYQKLCGQKALDYVRFRHEDNDIVRAARQQDFLDQAKTQVSAASLLDDREKLIETLGKYTRSDISSEVDVLRLLKLAVASAGHPVQEIHFKGQLGQSYVTASPAALRAMRAEFLGTGGSTRSRKPAERRASRRSRSAGLEAAGAPGRDQGLKAIAEGARLPVYYPRVRTAGALFAGDPRVYGIRAPDGKVRQAYRMVLKRGLVGEYYGIEGTTWKDPPILTGPSEKQRIGGRTYELYFDGRRPRLVAWRTPRAVYWISNTLVQGLNTAQMLEIAKSASVAGG